MCEKYRRMKVRIFIPNTHVFVRIVEVILVMQLVCFSVKEH
jgi:hypothetical protein